MIDNNENIELDLRRQLANLKQELQPQLSPEAASIMDQATSELLDSGIIKHALGKGDQAPDFILPDAGGRNFRLKDCLERGPAVVTFYRGVW